MARPLRIEYPGAVYHITSRGNDKKAVFQDDQDRELFLNILAQVNKRYHWLCHAYCLMDNHYHLLIETPDGNLSQGMRQLNGVYTQAHNKKRYRSGHLFQGRFKAILIQKDTYLLAVARYIVLNPLRAQMVKRPEGWKWSSYRATVGQVKAHSSLTRTWILGQFGRTRAKAQKEYGRFVIGGIGRTTIWDEVKGQAILGGEDFVNSFVDYLKHYKDIPEISKSQRFANRLGLDELFDERILTNRHKRNKMIVEAIDKYGYTQRAIANHLGVHFTHVSRIYAQHAIMLTV
jgi:REP element-mobilizing transposase RayT